MSAKLFDQAQQIIEARSVWESKQRVYYKMRHDGLRRQNKPFPTAADLHFPLIDMIVRKAKPFWTAQATSTERLASFVALQKQQEATTSAAADFFDWELKQNTNFMPELVRAIDTMCLRGRGVVKALADPFDDYRLQFQSVDPLFILMAEGADDFEDADEWVHVMYLTVAAYKRSRRYEQSILQQIRGNKDFDTTSGALQDKEMREGINYSRNPNQVILFEHYTRTMGGLTVNTYSPMKPELVARKPFGVPYKIAGKVSCPFYSFKTEIKDSGWYSPRGLAELNAPFESYTCKLWNEKTDAMTFGNRPVFTSDSLIKNIANLRWAPGEFIPGNIQAVQPAQPAFSFDHEIAFARSTAEQVSMLPDFGIQQPGQPGQPNSPRTATENNRIAQLQTVGTEDNGRIFRMDLAKLYRHVWGLMLQFKRKNLSYYVGKELKELPQQALHDAYLITPDGSPDQWNKNQRIQRAQVRLQTFKGAPNVDQDVLVRDCLAADDPKFALEAFIPQNVKAGSEAEDEAMEILVMKDGYPAQVKPNEDHVTRIHVLLSWLKKQSMMGAPIDPMVQRRVQEHLAVHFQYLRKEQPQAARQVLMEAEAADRQAQPGPTGAPPTGGPPMPENEMNPS